MTLSRGERDRVVWGIYGLTVMAGVFQLYNLGVLLLILATVYNTYNEAS